MCKYVDDSELQGLGGPKDTFHHWITDVHRSLRKKGIRFDCNLIGSGSRNMVVRNCNEDGYYDLDFQIVLTKYPVDMKAKTIKDNFRTAFNNNKPAGFKDMRDRTQSLRTKDLNRGYGYDVIITKFDDDGSFYILYNDKDDNSANNFDYSWKPRKEMNKYRERFEKVKSDSKMYEHLRKKYLKKRHDYKDDTSPSKKKAYQILNEAVVETLKDFGYRI